MTDDDIEIEERRCNWLCQCGEGMLGIPESQVPFQCPRCGYRIRGDADWDDDDPTLWGNPETDDGPITGHSITLAPTVGAGNS